MTDAPLCIGAVELYWLGGGDFRLDGGAMFGAVPKALWQKWFPPDVHNTIAFCNAPLLIRTPDMNILVDSGLGNKLTASQRAELMVSSPWQLPEQLAGLGLERQDIDVVILTHGDFDHAGGVVMVNEEGREEVTFPAASYVVQEREWQDMAAPCGRSLESYWPVNCRQLRGSGRVQRIQGGHQVCPEARVNLTGGHTRGHQLVEITSGGETAVHLGDLFPTLAHVNPLWIMAYDNFPLEVIACKERYFAQYRQRDAWFTLYHDPQFRAFRFGDRGRLPQAWP